MGFGQWMSAFGPALGAKREQMEAQSDAARAQAAANYSNAALTDTNASLRPGESAAEIAARNAQASNFNANASNLNAQTREVAPNALVTREKDRAAAKMYTSNAGLADANAADTRQTTRATGQFMPGLRDDALLFNRSRAAQRSEFGLANGGRVMDYASDGMTGYMNGGMTGYMHGGMTAPMRPKMRGYANGGGTEGMRSMPGPIGDVAADTGRDTVDVKVRPGEYMLNPETVARAFGEGNYEMGLRNLDEIVRQATGKEPGPSPVGKSGGKAGFADSGRVFFTPPPMDADTAARLAAAQAQSGGGQAAETLRQAARDAAARSSQPPSFTETWRAANGRGANQPWAQAGRQAGAAVGEVLDSPAAANAMGALKTAAKVGVPAAALEFLMPRSQEFYGDDKVPTWDKARQFGRDVANEVGGVAAGALGAGLGSAVTPIVGTGVGAVTGYAAGKQGVNALVNAAFGQGPAAAYEKKMLDEGRVPQTSNRSLFGDNDKVVMPDKDKDKPPLEARLVDPRVEAALKAEADKAARMQLVEKQFQAAVKGMAANPLLNRNGASQYISDMARVATAGASGEAKGASAERAKVKEINEMIEKRYQLPVRDKDGQITGAANNPEAVVQVRDMLAQKGIDLYSAPPPAVDAALREIDRIWRGNQNFNQAARESRGENAEISNDIRGLRRRPMEWGDWDWLAPKSTVTGTDLLRSVFKGGINDEVVVDDNRTGQIIPLRNAIRDPNGGLNQDLLQYLRK